MNVPVDFLGADTILIGILWMQICASISADIIVLTKMWLNVDHDMPEKQLDGHQNYRVDRYSRSSNRITGGGSLIAVNDSYYSSQIPTAAL